MERRRTWSLETGGSRADHAARALVLKKRDDAETARHPLLLQRDVSREFSLSLLNIPYVLWPLRLRARD